MKVRPVIKSDIPNLTKLIYKKAAFDTEMGSFSGIASVTEEKLYKTLFSPKPDAHVLIAEDDETSIGFIFYEFRYSSFSGQPYIWLADLFIDERVRGRGVGAALMKYLSEIAKENDSTHLAWYSDSRNIRGLNFYRRLGAKDNEPKGNLASFRWLV
jgi:GNAT superfamily N-acetyltransferase